MAIKKLSSFPISPTIDTVNDLIPISKLVSPGLYETKNIPSGLVKFSGDYDDLTNKPNFGSAAYLEAGTTSTPDNVVQLDNDGKLPALDGSQLTNVKLSNYLSSKGDLVSFSTTQSTISLGMNGQVLTVDENSSNGTGIKWAYAPYQKMATTKTADYTIVQADHGLWIPCDTNNLTITFPSNLTNGTQVIIDRQGTATVSFAVTGGATLVSKSTAIANQYGVVAAVFNETENYWRLTGDL